ncbi:MAG: ribosomal-processing cysteine protease Prp [Christensenellales bacterium]|jgi:uncharacterized protein YsxB (DUF464 family)
MTYIRLLGRQGTCQGFEVSGHTGAGNEGNDLVCAAISFLATTCVNALETVADTKPGLTLAEGYLKAVLSGLPNDRAITILKTFSQGAMDLAQTYPGHVTFLDETI